MDMLPQPREAGEYRRPGLPPRDAWRYDIKKRRPRPTPQNRNGLVVKEALVEMVLKAIEPDYKWVPDYNLHHMTHPHNAYPNGRAARYKELPTNKLLLPIEAHNLIHTLTHEPSVPSQRTMHRQINQWERMRSNYAQGKDIIRDGVGAFACIETLQQERPLPWSFRSHEQAAQLVMVEMLHKYFMPQVIDLSQLQIVEQIPEPAAA